MSEVRRRNLITVLRRVMRTPFALGTMLLGLLWMALFQGSALGFAGLGASALAVAVYTLGRLQDESFIRTAIHEAGERNRKAAAERREFRIEELDVDSRVRMKSIVRLANEIAEDVVNSPVDEVAVGLADTVNRAEALVDRGLSLAQRRRELLRYLNRTDDQAIEARIAGIRGRLGAETDSATRTELEASLAAKLHELDDYRAIERAANRILAELDGIEVAFSSLRARLVRIRSGDLQDWTEANVELQTELGSLNNAVDILEQSIGEALSISDVR